MECECSKSISLLVSLENRLQIDGHDWSNGMGWTKLGKIHVLVLSAIYVILRRGGTSQGSLPKSAEGQTPSSRHLPAPLLPPAPRFGRHNVTLSISLRAC